MTSPTAQDHQRAFGHFNAALFGGRVPPCVLTLSRTKKYKGFFLHAARKNAKLVCGQCHVPLKLSEPHPNEPGWRRGAGAALKAAAGPRSSSFRKDSS